MTAIEILSKQTKDAYDWVNKLVTNIPETSWNTTTDVLESNISWQVGHLVISMYYHSILVINGHDKDVFDEVPLKQYSELYAYGSAPKNSASKATASDLLNHLNILMEKSLKSINSVTMAQLQEKLVPGKVEHPVAKTKFEAIDWNVKHVMWHCGQIATLKRIVDKPHNFLLKKTE